MFIHNGTLKSSLLPLLGVATAALLVVGCQDSAMIAPGEEPSAEGPEVLTKNAQGNAPMASAKVLRARLEPVGPSGVTGEVTVRLKGNDLEVSVNAKGLKASVEHAQHFHQNGSCAAFGPVVISLDDDIANAPGDAINADEGDDSFPVATPGGTVNYRERTSKNALVSAFGGDLNLEDRTVVVHAAGTPIGPPAACGELNPVGR
jgi:Cu/Zn superoxide dismutase